MDVFRQFFFKNAVPTWCPCSPVVALCWCTGRTPEEVSPPRCSPGPSCKTSVPALQHNNNSNRLWEFCCNSNSLNTIVEDWTERQGRPKVYYVDRPLQLEGSNPWKQQPPEVGGSSGPVERKFRWPRSDLCGPDWIQFQKKNCDLLFVLETVVEVWSYFAKFTSWCRILLSGPQQVYRISGPEC